MSWLEEAMALQIKAKGLPVPEREASLLPGRRWRCDFCWPATRLVLEVEGGTWSRGRHTRGAGFERDCEKYNLLTIAGWRVLRVTGGHIDSGAAIRWLEAALVPEVRND